MTDGIANDQMDIKPIPIETEMKNSYLDYAMSVIVSRALPDVRDGMKPVHRRILHVLKEGNYISSRPYKKSARIVGDVMGKYHPHGDSAIYDALVRMAQDFSMRLPLVDGQGNFGSMDGDPPAAMRYTEARSEKAAEILLEDIDKDTVDFRPNYDESTQEPVVLPARYPNLLVNGASGIAVGMATNIPPHNLGELLDACDALIDNPEMTVDELLEIVPGPDFPTGGEILGMSGTRSAYETGNGSITMRAKAHIEEVRGRDAIVITEMPYQINKAQLIEKMANQVKEETLKGIADIRDESDRDGVRLVVECKRNTVPEIILNRLFRHTRLQTNFGANMLAINGGQPMMMSLREILLAFLDFREEVITRRTLYDLNKARERAHVLIGLAVAVVNIDEVIQVIRHAPDPATARTQLMDRSWPAKDVAPLIRLVNEPQSSLTEDGEYQMTEAQVKAILDLKLQRLTGLEREKVANELEDLTNEIQEYLEILGDRDKLISVMRDELAEVKEKFATPRRTSISEEEFERDIEDLIQREDMVVTVSHSGYIKRVPLKTYRAQRRGGKGRTGAKTKEEDFVSELFVANTHTAMLFFTDKGMAYELKVYKLPLGSPTSRGKPLINLLPLDKDEKVTVVTPLTDEDRDNDELDILFATSHGSVRRNTLDQFTSIRSNGLIAMKLEDDENLIAARICKESDDVILASRLGQAVRFNIGDNVRVFSGRYSTGVRGIRLAKGDEVISMSIVSSPALDPDERDQYLKMFRASENGSPQFNPDIIDDELALDAERFNQLAAEEEFLLSVATRGYGKRTSVYEYRQTNRGGKGVTNMKLTEKTGDLVGCFPVRDGNQLMMVTDGGQMIRIPVNGISIISRHTQGVRLFRVAKGEHIASVAKIVEEDDETGPDEAAAVDEIHAAPGSEVADPDTVEPDTTSTESE